MSANTGRSFAWGDVQLACHLKILAHRVRLAIVRLLAEREERICGEIVADLSLSQSTVSQHLEVLKDPGLVQGTIEGPQAEPASGLQGPLGRKGHGQRKAGGLSSGCEKNWPRGSTLRSRSRKVYNESIGYYRQTGRGLSGCPQ